MKIHPLSTTGRLQEARKTFMQSLRRLRRHGRHDLASRASMLGLGLWLATFAVVLTGLVPKWMAVFPVTIASVIAFYALAALVEKSFPVAVRAHSTRVFGAAALAIVSFLAHGNAVGEVNAIFHVDAASFPHATTAATVFVILSWTFWPAILLLGHSLVMGFVAIRNDDVALGMTRFTALLGSFTLVTVVGLQFHDVAQRANNVYQVARAFDFNERFECDGPRQEGDGAAFVGPEQRRAVIAPRLAARAISRDSLFKRAEIPERFEIVACR